MSESSLLPDVVSQLVEHFGVGQVIAAMLEHEQIARKLREGEHYFSITTTEQNRSEWTQECVLTAHDYRLVGRSSRQRPVF